MNGATEATNPSSSPIPAKSFHARLVGVIYSPGETFEDIARKPGFWPMLITIVVFSIATTETLLDKIGMARVIRMQLEQSGRAQSMTADQMQAAIQRGAMFGAILARVGEVLGPPISLLILAGIGLLILNAFFGAETKFRAVFSATCFAFTPALISELLAMAMFFFADPNQLNMQDPTPTNPGFFMNPLTASKPLLALASSLDIFTFWVMALLAIGLSRVANRKVKAAWIFGCYFGLWLIVVFIKVGFALLT